MFWKLPGGDHAHLLNYLRALAELQAAGLVTSCELPAITDLGMTLLQCETMFLEMIADVDRVIERNKAKEEA